MRERAEPDCSAHATADLAEAVCQRAWLPPCVASLTALARNPHPATWSQVRVDPGAVLLLLRRPLGDEESPLSPRVSLLTRLRDPAVLEEAAYLLDQPPFAFVDWHAPTVRPVYDAALTLARLARVQAELGKRCDPEEAWVCGLLAPLGWLGACASDPDAVAACLADKEFAAQPLRTQRRRWGLDQAALARRLARHWRLPGWVAAVVGCLPLPPETAHRLGADAELFAVARRAVEIAREQGIDLGLCEDSSVPLPPQVVSRQVRVPEPTPAVASTPLWESPYEQPLLRDLLLTAAENRRLRDAPGRPRLEVEIDQLHEALAEQAGGEVRRLHDGKLAALAEFAAGAGHEINNPLAVISGQAQYLLARSPEWYQAEPEGARKALQAVVAQTHRIHALLRDLMQFARPPAPLPVWFDLPALMAETAATLGEPAAQRRVRIEVGRTPERLAVHADQDQVRVILACLLRNAIEAAPADGWARVSIHEPVGDAVLSVIVEDSGSGPDPAQRASLFDPFYSGRAAGRGRGMGLPIAWRLARLQGGDVRLDAASSGEPTRFLLLLPRPPAPAERPVGVSHPLPAPAVNGRLAS